MANIWASCSTSTASSINLCIGSGGAGGGGISIGTSNTGGYSNISIGNNITSGYSWVDKTTSMQEYIEFGLKLMGIDLSFEDFQEMNESERKAFMRNHRLDNLLKNKED